MMWFLAIALVLGAVTLVYAFVILARCTAALSLAVRIPHRLEVQNTTQAATITAYRAEIVRLRAELNTVRPPF